MNCALAKRLEAYTPRANSSAKHAERETVFNMAEAPFLKVRRCSDNLRADLACEGRISGWGSPIDFDKKRADELRLRSEIYRQIHRLLFSGGDYPAILMILQARTTRVDRGNLHRFIVRIAQHEGKRATLSRRDVTQVENLRERQLGICRGAKRGNHWPRKEKQQDECQAD